MQDCDPHLSYLMRCESDNCTQPLATVKLDPTTRAGASCLRQVPRDVPDPSLPLFITNPFSPSE